MCSLECEVYTNVHSSTITVQVCPAAIHVVRVPITAVIGTLVYGTNTLRV